MHLYLYCLQLGLKLFIEFLFSQRCFLQSKRFILWLNLHGNNFKVFFFSFLQLSSTAFSLMLFRNRTFGDCLMSFDILRETTPSFHSTFPPLTKVNPLLISLAPSSPSSPLSLLFHRHPPLPLLRPFFLQSHWLSVSSSLLVPPTVFLFPSHSGQFSPTSAVSCSFSFATASVILPSKNTLSSVTYDLLFVKVNNLSLVLSSVLSG